jgi:hypothetical protein
MGEILEFTIYSITCFNEKVKGIYVGSTKDFVDRQIKQKYASNDKNRKHLKVYRVINENGGWDNWEFTCLQIRNCTEIDARIIERDWYDKLKADLNTYRPYISDQETKKHKAEYYIENKEKILEHKAEYYIENKEKILEQKQQYYIENKDKMLEHKKQFYYKNQEKTLGQKQQYYIENKERIASRYAEKLYCDSCEVYHSRGQKSRHYKTQKHINNIAKISDE